ncbi:MAG: DUF4365 domain-containing protein [Acidobacteriota bacterium]|nr:DUF4365 domain-containing protein [Acidobacteriota bacterium]
MPSEWVVRPQDSDYGLDVQVQIFENGRITPLFFYAQLKATENLPKAEAPAWRFSTTRLLHYGQCPFPVMLLLFEASSKRLFFKWVHDFYMELSQEEERKLKLQDTISVELPRLLTGADKTSIQKEVQNQFLRLGYRPALNEVFRITLSVDIPEHSAESLKVLTNWLSQDQCTQFVRISKIHQEPDGSIKVLSIPTGEEEPASIITCVVNDSLYPLSTNSTIEIDQLLSDLIIAVALALSASGRSNSALDVLGRFFSEEHRLDLFADTVLTTASLAGMYASAHRSAEAIEIAERLLERGYLEPAIVLSAAVLLADNRHFYLQQHRRFLKAVIESDAGSEMGSPEYNLANSLRHEGYHRQALQHYRKAARKDPTYLTRPYWWAEFAGCLFLLERFIWSEAFYRKAINLGEVRLPAQALLGDALLHQGRFEEGKVALEKYLETASPPLADAVLRCWMAGALTRKFGNQHRRSPLLARKLVEEALTLEDASSREELFLQAMRADPLCGAAWFNYAVTGSQPANGMGWIWLIAAILEPWDVNPWANAILLASMEGREEMVWVVTAAMFEANRLHGPLLAVTLEEILSQQPNLDKQQQQKILAALDVITKESKIVFKQEPSFELRGAAG